MSRVSITSQEPGHASDVRTTAGTSHGTSNDSVANGMSSTPILVQQNLVSSFPATLPPDPLVAPVGHLLAHPRTVHAVPDAVDVSTTSAHDFDVDARSGFMPPLPPVSRLPLSHELWEITLEKAVGQRLKPAEAAGLTAEDEERSEEWRANVRQLPVLPSASLEHSETLLRRAHHVLTYLLAFYSCSHPRPAPNTEPAPLRIPPAIAVPLSRVSRQLGIAPVVTYADTVLWNWARANTVSGLEWDPIPIAPREPNLNILAVDLPAAPNSSPLPEMRCLSLFSGLKSEEHFYLTSARIELVSARALSHMQRTLDELFLSDAIAVRRITDHLTGLARNIDEMTVVLNTMYDGCDPTEFYRDIRPWFRGGEAWPGGAGWEFEGVDNPEERERARFTNGASAGQSSIVHALDIFLGTPNTHSAYLHKMEYHMPRHHRAFLRHLRTLPPHLKLADLLQSSLATDAVKNAFNDAVMALKRFRDSHIRIAAVYIISQARRAGEGIVSHATPVPKHASGDGNEPTTGVKGTGGTDLVPFLKNLRDNTARTLIPVGEGEESGR